MGLAGLAVEGADGEGEGESEGEGEGEVPVVGSAEGVTEAIGVVTEMAVPVADLIAFVVNPTT